MESQGSGYVIVNYCRGLHSLGHEVDVFAPDDYELWQQWRGRANSYRQALGMLPFTLRQVSKKTYDILEFYGGEAWLTIWVLRQLFPKRWLLVAHSNGIEPLVTSTMIQAARAGIIDDPLGKWYQFNQSSLFATAFRQVHGIVTVSDRERDYALRQGYQDDAHVVAIDNPLPDDYHQIPITLDRPLTIGYCGSWIPRKGIHLIQQDMAYLLREYPRWHLMLIGVGQNFQKQAYFPASLHHNITVIPQVDDRAELRRLYQSMAILIAPSVYESFGLTIAEAMACGCAVVTSNTGFGSALQSSREAMILDNLQSPALYNAVKTLVVNDQLRRTIARAGYQRVQGLRWKPAIKRLEHTYFHWLEEFQSGRMR